MHQEDRGSYTQLSTINGPYNYTTEPCDPAIKLQRTHFSRRDCIIVSIVLGFILVIAAVTLALGIPKIREKREKYFDTTIYSSPSKLEVYEKVGVATDGIVCAPIGKEILKNGGSAVDAALALLICDGVVTPQSTGLGGGFLMTIYNRQNKSVEIIDARETAPLASTIDMFHGNSTAAFEGGLSIAVPGELKGYRIAHERHGKIPWKQLFEPSIKLAEEGFKVSKHLAEHLKNKREKIINSESMREEFFNVKTEDVYKAGEILKRPVLAQTLSSIAENGTDQFYTGDMAKILVEDIQEAGGIITEEDLKNYEVKIKHPSSFQLLNGDTIFSVPPSGSGYILGFIFNILQGYNLTADSVDSQILSFHRIIEAFKFAFSQRSKLGDNMDLTTLFYNLTSPAFGAHIRNLTSDKLTFNPEYYGPTFDKVEDSGTAQVSVLAENGDAVSVTSTINAHFGSLVRSKRTGIIFNNEMDDFSSPNITNQFDLPPSVANFIAPGKRPISSMCPTVVVKDNGDVRLVIGGVGGSRIITATAWSIIRLLLGDDLKKAIDFPRLHHQLYPNILYHEQAFPIFYLDGLKKYSHKIELETQSSAIYGIRRRADNSLECLADHRKGGSVDGF